jgi:thioredoxin-like negative regulator of GroEL
MTSAASARILITPQCPHCPSVINSLVALLKKGKIGKLEIINIAEHPEVAQQAGVRSVPWTQIGSYELSGALSSKELEEWAAQAAGEQHAGYLAHLLETNRLADAVEQVTNEPRQLAELLLQLGESDTPMAVKIGIGALLEELSQTPLIDAATAPLLTLLAAENPQVRADAAHYLSLSGDPATITALEQLLDDADAEVREIAAESLAELKK